MAPIVNYLLTFIYVVSMEIKNAIIRIKCGVEVKSPNDTIIENCVKHEASYCKYRLENTTRSPKDPFYLLKVTSFCALE